MHEEIYAKIRDILGQNERIAIAVGKNPTLDQMAGALSLYLAISQTGKKASVSSPTDPIVEISSLVGINKVKQAITSDGGDLTVSFPYQEGEIEKVSYTLENGYLNIIVKAGEQGLSFDQKEVVYKRAGSGPSVLVLVGTKRLSDLGHLFNPDALKDTLVINIDNQSDNEGFGDVVFVSPQYSSISEMIASLLFSLGYQIDTDIAQNLVSGISYATENFQKQTTSSLAFEMTGNLLKKGAVRPRQMEKQQVKEYDRFFSQAQQQPAMQQPRKHMGQRQYPQNAQQRPQHNTPRFQNQQQATGQQVQQRQQEVQPSMAKEETPRDKMEHVDDAQDTPPDWLTPKVYKGSTLL